MDNFAKLTLIEIDTINDSIEVILLVKVNRFSGMAWELNKVHHKS